MRSIHLVVLLLSALAAAGISEALVGDEASAITVLEDRADVASGQQVRSAAAGSDELGLLGAVAEQFATVVRIDYDSAVARAAACVRTARGD